MPERQRCRCHLKCRRKRRRPCRLKEPRRYEQLRRVSRYAVLARDVTHSAHLNTRSFAKHKALGKFYPEIIDLADKFAEMYQGKYGLIGPDLADVSQQDQQRAGVS
jgi:hypothetical protein